LIVSVRQLTRILTVKMVSVGVLEILNLLIKHVFQVNTFILLIFHEKFKHCCKFRRLNNIFSCILKCYYSPTFVKSYKNVATYLLNHCKLNQLHSKNLYRNPILKNRTELEVEFVQHQCRNIMKFKVFINKIFTTI